MKIFGLNNLHDYKNRGEKKREWWMRCHNRDYGGGEKKRKKQPIKIKITIKIIKLPTQKNDFSAPKRGSNPQPSTHLLLTTLNFQENSEAKHRNALKSMLTLRSLWHIDDFNSYPPLTWEHVLSQSGRLFTFGYITLRGCLYGRRDGTITGKGR